MGRIKSPKYGRESKYAVVPNIIVDLVSKVELTEPEQSATTRFIPPENPQVAKFMERIKKTLEIRQHLQKEREL